MSRGFSRTFPDVDRRISFYYRLGVAPNALTPTSTTASPAPTQTVSPLPIGAIVGGAVGGVIGITVVIAFAWYMVTKLKTKHPMSDYPPEYPTSPGVPSSPRPMSPAVEKPIPEDPGYYQRPGSYPERPRPYERPGAGEQRNVEEEMPGSPRLRYPEAEMSGNLLPNRHY